MKQTKMLVSFAALTMMGSLIAGCSSSGGSAAQTGKDSGTGTAKFEGYPIQTNKTLTYWSEMNANIQSVKPTFAEVPFFQEWQKRTGVKLKFTQPPANQAKEALNVLLASGELPDMMEYSWGKDFPGGPEKAINDGYILKLNDAIDKYAPNLKQYLKDHPEVDKQIKTDNGSYYVFPFIRGDDLLKTYQGPIIRKDWLDELGLPVPVTMDDWYTTLKAFKEKKGIAAPLTFLGVPSALFGLDGGGFIGSYGVIKGYYLDNGKVKYGPMEPGYKEFLTTFRKWYQEGLIDKNVATVDTKTMDSNMTSGRSGASIFNSGAGIGKWQPLLKEKDPKAQLVPAPYPVVNKGDKAKFGQKDFAYVTVGGVAISAQSKNIEEAVRMLDYAYGKEGNLFFNFGIEGTSYKMEGDYPKYTDLIMNNPDKLAPAQALALYARGGYNGPFVQDKRYIEQYLTMPEQKEAIKIWSNTDAEKYTMPPISTSPEESAEFASIMNDIQTLVDEMSLKIILGAEPVESFDKYIAKMKSLKIDRALEIQKGALDRYNKR
ncbi:extracellular solute-binding protein [Paenibacillus sp. RC67]|uniref:extracellular solute-binding protein n=1 Tax=Paenibacillus sp. RC67 TaxID=3039392 RepID=UPI0024AD90A8|nr:extracellular solute-binding protein [Paenibacillus sp. RC67]